MLAEEEDGRLGVGHAGITAPELVRIQLWLAICTGRPTGSRAGPVEEVEVGNLLDGESGKEGGGVGVDRFGGFGAESADELRDFQIVVLAALVASDSIVAVVVLLMIPRGDVVRLRRTLRSPIPRSRPTR
ncbi:hypothetical protein HQQ81_12365 [Microbacteriaceae bacterium VKM Ac-2854]|nr:hypothetical protein [Microbacteriaceae bacterium VKM Ac-2854]